MTISDQGPWLLRGFGMTIRSEVPLPELPAAAPGSAPDLRIDYGETGRPDPALPYGRDHDFSPGEQYFGLAFAGKYLVRGTDRILFEPTPSLPAGLAGYALLGPVMALLLHARGHLVLHGSALDVDGRAVLFLGDKGAGKSTTAGAMVDAGYPLITDDVVAVAPTAEGIPAAIPSYPMLKLSDAALDAMDARRFEILPTAIAGISKKRVLPRLPLPEAPVPIARIYILERGTTDAPPLLTPAAPGAALSQLLTHSYMARYGTDAFRQPGAMARHLRQCADLVGHARVARLQVPGRIDRLPELVAAVVRDSRANGAES